MVSSWHILPNPTDFTKLRLYYMIFYSFNLLVELSSTEISRLSWFVMGAVRSLDILFLPSLVHLPQVVSITENMIVFVQGWSTNFTYKPKFRTQHT